MTTGERDGEHFAHRGRAATSAQLKRVKIAFKFIAPSGVTQTRRKLSAAYYKAETWLRRHVGADENRPMFQPRALFDLATHMF